MASYDRGLNSDVPLRGSRACWTLSCRTCVSTGCLCCAVLQSTPCVTCQQALLFILVVTCCQLSTGAGNELQPGTDGTASGALRKARLLREVQQAEREQQAATADNEDGRLTLPIYHAGQITAILQATAPGKRCTWCGTAPRLGLSGSG